MEKESRKEPFTGQWLVNAHRSLGMSAQAFKREAHLGNDTYADIVHGRRLAGIAVYAKILAYLYEELEAEDRTHLCEEFVKFLMAMRIQKTVHFK